MTRQESGVGEEKKKRINALSSGYTGEEGDLLCAVDR